MHYMGTYQSFKSGYCQIQVVIWTGLIDIKNRALHVIHHEVNVIPCHIIEKKGDEKMFKMASLENNIFGFCLKIEHVICVT